MDNGDLQHELHVLKERVSGLSLKYSPRIQTRDPFTEQVEDLKAHVALMQGRVAACESSILQPSYAIEADSTCSNINTQNQLTVPSGPLLWELFKNLRADVQSLGTRVGTVENSVSDLEDKVDSLDPNRFTPPGSDAVSNTVQHNTFNIRNRYPAAVPELYAGMAQNGHTFASAQNTSGYPAAVHYPEAMPDSPRLHHENWRPVNPVNQQQYQDETEQRSTPVSMSTVIAQMHEHRDELLSHIGKLGQDNEKILRAVQDSTRNGSFGGEYGDQGVKLPVGCRYRNSHDGLAFRDREIARMDEQLRTVQDRLRTSEETITQNRSLIAQLQLERDDYIDVNRDWAQRDDELTDKVLEYRNKLQAREEEVDDMKTQLADAKDTLRKWDESWTHWYESYEYANNKAQSYERYLQEERQERERSDAELERINHEHENGMRKLRDFCEQKDAVISKQEQVISRGGNLLEERDAEIENLQRRLRDMGEQKEYADRIASRTARLLEERDAELAEVKAAHQNSSSKGSNSAIENEERVRPSDDGRVDMQETSKRYERHPSADRHTHHWYTPIPEIAQADFAHSTLTRSPTDRKRRGRAEGRQRRLPHRAGTGDQYQGSGWSGSRSDGAHEQTSSEAKTRQNVAKERHNNSASYHAVPAQGIARRMQSDTNLRSTSLNEEARARRSLAKHQSLQELLPNRRRLQAYVESEVESELGGHV